MRVNSILVDGALPNGIKPYKHQIDAANQILHERSVLLAYDVGVGKTFTAAAAGLAYQKMTGGKVVVVAPASLQGNWTKEVDGLMDIELFSSGKIPEPGDFGGGQFFLIIDEAHQFQNPYSKRTKAITALARQAQGVLPMTATPIRNYPSNLFPLLKLINHPLGKDFAYFKEQYCDGKIGGSSNLMTLHRQIQTKLITGSKEAHLDLPTFSRVMKPIVFDGVGQILFNKAMRERRAEYHKRVASGKVSGNGWSLVMLNHLRQAASFGKSVYAVKLARAALNKGHQVAIFTNYNLSANYIDNWLDEHGSELLNGAVPKKKRQNLVDRFQDGDSKVFVMTRAGSAGLNLQEGTVFISVDRTWSPFDMVQAEGRIHRNGQDKPCYSIWVQDKVIDPFLDRMMLRKYRVAREALYGTIDRMPGVGDPGSWADDLGNFLFAYK